MKKYKILLIFSKEGFSIQCADELKLKIYFILPKFPEDLMAPEFIKNSMIEGVVNLRFKKFVEMISTELSDLPLRLPTGYSIFSFDTEVKCDTEEIVNAMTEFVMFCYKNIGVRDSEFKQDWWLVAEKFLYDHRSLVFWIEERI